MLDEDEILDRLSVHVFAAASLPFPPPPRDTVATDAVSQTGTSGGIAESARCVDTCATSPTADDDDDDTAALSKHANAIFMCRMASSTPLDMACIDRSVYYLRVIEW